MERSHFPGLPPEAFASLGGFRWVKADKWRRYLGVTIWTRYPAYGLKKLFHRGEDRLWQENNCIYASLAKYLFEEFGVVVPEDSLFELYNQDGEGVSPRRMIASISAIIEPLGFIIDRVLVPDQELRSGLGKPGPVVDLSQAAEFEGRAGIGMINIKAGYSHAFFWKQLDSAKFTDERFRMAVIVKPRNPDFSVPVSALQAFDEYYQLLHTTLAPDQIHPNLLAELDCLSNYIHEPRNRQEPHFRREVDQGFELIDSLIRSPLANGRGKQTPAQNRYLVQSGKVVRRIFREFGSIG